MLIKRFYSKVIFIVLLCAVFGQRARGQEEPWSLQYLNNMHVMNPAFVGMWNQSGLMVSTRTNWVGIHGAPLSQYLGYFAPIKDQKSGYGLNIQRFNTGLEKRLSFTLDYSYQVRLDLLNYFRFGLRAGIVNYDNNLADYQLYPDQVPDPEFIPDIRFYNMTTFGVGGVFYNDHLFVSFSIPQVINNTFQVNKNNLYSSLANPKTAYLSGSMVFGLVNNIFLRPNLLLVGTLGKPLYIDAAALVYLPSNLQLGVNVRSMGTVCLSIQYKFKNNIRLGYASDYALTSDIRKYQAGTYEFIIGYDITSYRRRYAKPTYF